jgi:hypothetical protein
VVCHDTHSPLVDDPTNEYCIEEHSIVKLISSSDSYRYVVTIGSSNSNGVVFFSTSSYNNVQGEEKILIVDDDPDITFFFEESFRRI